MLLSSEHNARIHFAAAVAVVAVGLLLHLERWEWCVVILSVGGVFMAEGFNSAVEALADKVSPEFSPLIGKAKDIAAGAVLLFVIGVVIVGLVVFMPHIMSLLCL